MPLKSPFLSKVIFALFALGSATALARDLRATLWAQIRLRDIDRAGLGTAPIERVALLLSRLKQEPADHKTLSLVSQAETDPSEPFNNAVRFWARTLSDTADPPRVVKEGVGALSWTSELLWREYFAQIPEPGSLTVGYRARALELMEQWYQRQRESEVAKELDERFLSPNHFSLDAVDVNASVPELLSELPLSEDFIKTILEINSFPAGTNKREVLLEEALESVHQSIRLPLNHSPAAMPPLEAISTREPAFESAELGIELLSKWASLEGKNKEAELITALGQSAIGIAKALNAYQTANEALKTNPQATPYGTLRLTTDIGSTIARFLSLALLSGRPSFEEVVLKELDFLKSLVTELHQHLDARLDHLEASVEVVFETLQVRLNQISAQLERHTLRETDIQSFLVHLEQRLRAIEGSQYALTRAGFERPVALRTDSCLNQQTFDIPQTRSHYVACLSDIKTFAVLYSRDAIESGGPTAANHSSFPLIPSPWHHINSLAMKAATDFDHSRALTDPRGLVNPLAWGKYAVAYLKLSTAWPDIFRQYGASQLSNEILAAGESLSHSLASLTLEHSAPRNAQRSPQLLFRVLRQYQTATEQLSSVIEDSRRTYETILPELDGLGLNASAAQFPQTGSQRKAFRSFHIPICQGKIAHSPHTTQPKLPTPVALQEPAKHFGSEPLIPAIFLNAHHLGIGRISLCYDSVEWTDKQWDITSTMPHFQYGRLSVVIRASISAGEQSWPIFARRVQSNHLYLSGWFPPHQRAVENLIAYNLPYLEPKSNERRVAMASAGVSVLEEGLLKDWSELSLKLNSDFEELLTTKDRDSSEKEVSKLIENHLLHWRKQFYASIENDPSSGRLSQARTSLRDSKNLLIAFTSLALPLELEKNDNLRKLLSGNSSLWDGSLSRLDNRHSAEDPMVSLLKQNANQIAQYEAIVTRRLLREDKEELPLLSNILEALRLLKVIHDRARPLRPMSEVLPEIQMKIKEFLAS